MSEQQITEVDAGSAGQPLPGGAVKNGDQQRRAIWVELPRQLIFSVLAMVLAYLTLIILRITVSASRGSLGNMPWNEGLVPSRALTELLSDRLANSIILLLVAHFLALFLALLPTAVAWLAERADQQMGWPGSAIKAIGRLWFFSQAAVPVAVLSAAFIALFALRLRWLPAAGMTAVGLDGDFIDRLRHLVLPATALALLPALLTAQVTARRLNHQSVVQRTGRYWLGGLATYLGTWLNLAGLLLSGLVLVENIFNWPGLGRLTMQSLFRLDWPVFYATLGVMIFLLLPARLGAVVFHWLARYLASQDRADGNLLSAPIETEATERQSKARRIWLIVMLLLLLAPVGFMVAGAAVGSEAALETDLGNVSSPPSPDHPWGTDRLGRDIRNLALRGSFNSLGMALAAGVLLLVGAGIAGSLAGYISRRQTAAAESIANLLLLPADALLFLPAIPLAIALSLIWSEPSWITVTLVLAVTLFPRVMRAAYALWPIESLPQLTGRLLPVGAGGILLATVYTALALVIAVDFLGLGLQPPAPTIGSVLGNVFSTGMLQQSSVFWVMLPAFLSAVTLYLTADAALNYFASKESLARISE